MGFGTQYRKNFARKIPWDSQPHAPAFFELSTYEEHVFLNKILFTVRCMRRAVPAQPQVG